MNFKTFKHIKTNCDEIEKIIFEKFQNLEIKSYLDILQCDVNKPENVKVCITRNFKSVCRDGAHSNRKRNCGRKLNKMYDSIEIKTYDSFWKDWKVKKTFFSIKEFNTWMETL